MVSVSLHETVDLLIAAVNVGLAVVVISMILHGWRREVCLIPFKTSLDRVFFLSVMGAALVLDQLWSSMRVHCRKHQRMGDTGRVEQAVRLSYGQQGA